MLYISISSDEASDSWGFVGVVRVGQLEAYRTMEAFATPSEAQREAQQLLTTVLGEMLAGREWERVRDQTGAVPVRQDFALSAFKTRRRLRDERARAARDQGRPTSDRDPNGSS
jgi:hypothetical protein